MKRHLRIASITAVAVAVASLACAGCASKPEVPPPSAPAPPPKPAPPAADANPYLSEPYDGDPTSLADDPVRLEAAQQSFKLGDKLYQKGRFLDAAKMFEQCYAASLDPDILFNIAQAYRKGGDRRHALHAYRAYLAKKPNSPIRAEVLKRIETMELFIPLPTDGSAPKD